MKYLKLKDTATIKLSLPEKSKRVLQAVECIAPMTLRENNQLGETVFDVNFVKEQSLLVRDNDILMRRVNPSFINYIENVDREIYIANNIFIIRVHNDFSSKYLAYILNEEVYKNYHKELSASLIPSLNRKTLEDIAIPELSFEKQEAIGKAWLTSLEKKNTFNKLAELEYKKEMQLIKQYTFGEK